MRDLLYRNLTSPNKNRRIITSSEIADKEGIRTVIQRHFIYIVKKINGKIPPRPKPYLYVLKEKSRKKQMEKFFCKIKGGFYIINNGTPALVLFTHSLKINLSATNKITHC